ncbi:MAG: hypothetical protein WCH13_17140, partial [Deltaproteobacteria bacterium]
ESHTRLIEVPLEFGELSKHPDAVGDERRGGAVEPRRDHRHGSPLPGRRPAVLGEATGITAT